MTQQTINIGSAANDRSGDPLRTAFTKINANFTDVYTQLSTIESGHALSVTSGSASESSSSLSYNSGTGVLSYTPFAMPTQTGNNGKVLTTNGSYIQWSALSINSLTNSGYTLELGSDGTLNLPISTNGQGVIQTTGSYYLDANGAVYGLGSNGTFSLPGNIVFPQGNLGVPNINGTTDSIRLYDFGQEGTQYNYAIGSEGSHIWFNVDQGNSDSLGFKFYGAGTLAAKITTAGNLYIGGIKFNDNTTQTTAFTGTANSLTSTSNITITADTAGTSKSWTFGENIGAFGANVGVIGLPFASGGIYSTTNGVSVYGDYLGKYGINFIYGGGDPITQIVSGTRFDIQTNINNSGFKTFSFGADGTLKFPDTTVQSTAWTGSTSTLVNGSYTLSLASNGDLLVPTSQYGTAQVFAATNNTTLFLGNSSHYIQVRGSDGALVFPDSSVQTTAYQGQVVKTGFNVQYPSVSSGVALFNIDNAGHPTVGATSGTWTGPWTAQAQIWNGSAFVTTTYGSTSNTWTSVASYGIGITFGHAGDQVVGYFTDNDHGHIYKVTWIATATGPASGYGFISVETLV